MTTVGTPTTQQKKSQIGLSSLFHCPKSLPVSSFKCPTVVNNMSNNWKGLMPVGFIFTYTTSKISVASSIMCNILFVQETQHHYLV